MEEKTLLTNTRKPKARSQRDIKVSYKNNQARKKENYLLSWFNEQKFCEVTSVWVRLQNR